MRCVDSIEKATAVLKMPATETGETLGRTTFRTQPKSLKTHNNQFYISLPFIWFWLNDHCPLDCWIKWLGIRNPIVNGCLLYTCPCFWCTKFKKPNKGSLHNPWSHTFSQSQNTLFTFPGNKVFLMLLIMLPSNMRSPNLPVVQVQ